MKCFFAGISTLLLSCLLLSMPQSSFGQVYRANILRHSTVGNNDGIRTILMGAGTFGQTEGSEVADIVDLARVNSASLAVLDILITPTTTNTRVRLPISGAFTGQYTIDGANQTFYNSDGAAGNNTVIYRNQSTVLRAAADGISGVTESGGTAAYKQLVINAPSGDDIFRISQYQRLNCIKCVGGTWSINAGRWVCGGTSTQQVDVVYNIALVNRNEDAGTFSPVCIDGTDPSLLSSTEQSVLLAGVPVLSISTTRGDFYNEATNLLDVSAHGSGAVSTVLTYSLTSSNTVNVIGSLTGTHTYTSGTINALPTVAFNNGAMCLGGSINLSSLASPSGGTFSGSYVSGSTFSGAPAGSYTVTYTFTNSNGCTSSRTATMTVRSLPSVSLSASSVCLGGSINLAGLASPAGGAFSGSNVSGTTWTRSSAASNTVTYTFTDANGCTNSASADMTVLALPDIDFDDAEVCAGESLDLNGLVSPTGGTFSGTGVSGTTFSSTTAGDYTITYTYTDGNGCTNSESETIRVNANPSVSFDNASVCAGTSLNLNSLVNISGGIFSGTGVSGSTFNTSAAGSYTLNYTYTNGDGCTASDNATITVFALPALDGGADVSFCEGGSVQLSATGALTYSWSPSAGLDFTNVADPVVSGITSSRAYTVTGTSAEGCAVTDEVLVTVYDLPVANPGDNYQVCKDQDLTLSADGAGPGGSYSWTGSGIVSGENTATPTINISTEATYTLTVTNANGCIDVAETTVRVNEAVADAGTDIEICNGESIVLNASGGDIYSWSPATGLSEADVPNPVASPSVTTVYSLTVVDSDGCVDTDNVQVTVNPIPVITVIDDQVICAGESVQLEATSDLSGSDFRWSPGSDLDNDERDTPVASPLGTTVYEVLVTSPEGCTATGEVTVLVNAGVQADAGNDFFVCEDVDSQLDGSESEGIGTLTYSWEGDGLLSGEDTAMPTFRLDNNETFTVTVTDANGCQDTDQVKVFVRSASANAGLNKEICLGEEIQLSASGGVSYEWSPATSLDDPTVPTPIADPTATTTYTVTVTDSDGCQDTDQVSVTVFDLPTLIVADDEHTICEGEEVVLSASGADGYRWRPATGLNITSLANVTARPTSTTIYTVEGTSSQGCSVEADVVVFVNELPEADAGDDEEACKDAPINLDGSVIGGTGPYIYQWTGSGLSGSTDVADPEITISTDETFTFLVTDANGCQDVDEVDVEVNEAIALAGTNVSICEGESIELNAGGGISYLWDADPSLSELDIDNPVASPTTTTTYSVTVVDNDGCVDSDEVEVTVLAVPVLSLSGDVAICDGEQVVLSASGANSYDWSPSSGLDVSVLAEVTASPDETTLYTVRGTNTDGCSSESSVLVTVHELPSVDAGSIEEICAGSTITLSGVGSGGDGSYGYSWAGDGIVTANDLAAIDVSIDRDETYVLTLTDGNGCTAVDEVEVQVNQLPGAFIAVDDFVTNSADICVGTTVQLEALGGDDYLWSGAPGISNPVVNDPVFTVNADVTLSVLVSDANGCEQTVSVDLTAVNNPVVDAGTLLNLCTDGARYDLREDVNIQGGVFTGQGVSGDFEFDPSGLSEGIYSVTYDVSVGGCSGTAVRDVKVNAPPTVSTGEDQTICRGSEVQLVATGALTYEWFPSAGVDDISSSSPRFSPILTTDYTVVGTDAFGCQSSDQVRVSVNDLSVSAGTNVTICEGSEVLLEASSNKSNVTYLWSPVEGLNDESVAEPTAAPSVTTTYTVTVTDELGCQLSDEVLVTVEERPTLEVGEPLDLCASSSLRYDLREDVNIAGGTFSSSSSGLEGVTFNPEGLNPGIYFVTYEVEVGNCVLSADREIRIREAMPVSVAEAELNTCKGVGVRLQAGGASTYEWTPAATLDDPFAASPIATPSSNITYTVAGTDAFGCRSTAEISVEVSEVNANAGPNQVICQGESIQLQASGGDFYSWSPVTGLDNNSISNPVASPTATTTYEVLVTDDEGCSARSEVVITVLPAPELLVGDKLLLCSNDPIGVDLRTDVNLENPQFTSTSNILNGVLAVGENEDPGIYFVDVVVNIDGCTVRGVREIEVVAPEQVVVFDDEVEVCEGESVQLSASGVQGYSWSPSLNISDTQIFNPFISTEVSRSYTVEGTDINSCTSSAVVDVEVIEISLTVSPDVSVCAGESIELSVDGADQYQWEPSQFLDDSRDDNPLATPLGTTLFTVTGLSSEGCEAETAVQVSVKPLPSLDLGGPISLCPADDALDVRSFTDIQGGTWSSDENILDGVLLDPSDLDAGIYFLEYTVSIDGCQVSASKEVRILETPSLIVTGPVEICVGGEVQLSAAGGVSYQWVPNTNIDDAGIFNPKVSPAISTIYTVTAEGLNGCQASETVEVEVSTINTTIISDQVICEGESIELFAGGGRDYVWSSPETLDDFRDERPVASPTVTTDYTVQITDRECSVERSVRVQVDPAPSIEVGDPLLICEDGQPYDLRADVSPAGGSFSMDEDGLNGVLFDPALTDGPGIYFVDYEVLVGTCRVSKTREVQVRSSPTVFANLTDHTLCQGDSVQIILNGGASYQWSPSAGVSHPSSGVTYVRPSSDTDYSVLVTDDLGCTSTVEIEIEISVPEGTAGEDIQICEGEEIELDASGGDSYLWDFDLTLKNRNSETPLVSPSESQYYYVRISDDNGCSKRDSVFIEVEELPDLFAGETLVLCPDGDPVDLRDGVSHLGGSFQSESSGLDGVLFDPAQEDPGIYFVDYIYTSGSCQLTATREVVIRSNPEIISTEDSYAACPGESVNMIVSGGVDYSWSPVIGLDAANVANPIAIIGSSQTYSVTVVDEFGCVSEKDIDIVVDEHEGSVVESVTTCLGSSVTLEASGALTYSWEGPSAIDRPSSAEPTVAPVVSSFYTVTMTNEFGCSLEDSVFVLVEPVPEVSVGEDIVLCYNGLPLDLREDVNQEGGFFTSSSSALDGVFFDPRDDDPGVYFVSYTLVDGSCSAEGTREITISGGPNVTNQRDDYTICPDESIDLEVVSDGDSYAWLPSTGLSATDVVAPSASPDRTTTYELVATDTSGCQTVTEVVVSVLSPEIDAGNALTMCADGEAINLNERIIGSWLGEGVVNNRFFPDLAGAGDKWISVISTSNDGCAGIDSVLFTVNELPEIVFGVDEMDLCINGEVTDLNQNVNLLGGDWAGRGVDDSGIFDPSSITVGTYPITFSYANDVGCSSEDFLTVVVKGLPTVEAGPDVSFCPDDPAISLDDLATPGGGSFFGSGIDEDGLFDAALTGQGDFTITYAYSDPVSGCINTDSRTVTVLEPDNVFAGADLSICINAGAVDLSESVSPAGGVFFAESGVNGNNFFPSSAGIGEHIVTYSITGTNGCPSSASRTIVVNEAAELELGDDISICENEEPVNLDLLPTIPGGLWSGQGVSENFFRPDTAGIGLHILSYEVETADGCVLTDTKIVNVRSVSDIAVGDEIISCVAGDNIDLLGVLNAQFTTISGPGVQQNTFFPSLAGPGTHIVDYELQNLNGCITQKNRSVVVQQDVFVSTTEDMTLCLGAGNLELKTRGFPDGGVWTGPGVLLDEFDPLESGLGAHNLLYTINLGNGCIDSDTLTVGVFDSGINDFGLDTIVCVNGAEINLNFSPELRTGTWEGDGVVSNQFFPSLAGEGDHLLRYVNDNFACDLAGQRKVSVVGLPPVAISDVSNRSGCVDDIIRLEARVQNAQQGEVVGYRWYREGEEDPFASGSFIDFRIEKTENIFYASVNQFGCQPNEVNFINIAANGPVGDFTIDTDSVEVGELVRFDLSASNTDQFTWNFGDGNFSTEDDPFYIYYVEGLYDVSVELVSPDGCTLVVEKEDALYVYRTVDGSVVLSSPLDHQKAEAVFYPNPFGDVLSIALDRPAVATVKIFDLNGRCMIEQEDSRAVEGVLQVETSVLPPGVYQVQLLIDGEDPVGTRIIKIK